jgi:hypothetical protein
MRLGVFAWGGRNFPEKYPNSGGNPRNVNPDGFVAVSVGEPINTNQINGDVERVALQQQLLVDGSGIVGQFYHINNSFKESRLRVQLSVCMPCVFGMQL